MKLIRWSRWLLSLLLLYGVFTETGLWTTLFLFLILVKCEIKKVLKRNEGGNECY